MINYLIVSAGAAIGGALRYWMSNFVYNFLPANFAYGTLSVNFFGSLLLGFIMFGLDAKELISPQLKLFLTIGLCGGFTTFSTFTFETFNLLKESQYLLASLNIVLNVFLCLAGIILANIISN
ncbi:MAG: fluoride efflux transporter CrcB [Ignavibacteriales bacterium]|nr:fluoride efflux transporter CrcB [Ignavibacteriales bacterium]